MAGPATGPYAAARPGPPGHGIGLDPPGIGAAGGGSVAVHRGSDVGPAEEGTEEVREVLRAGAVELVADIAAGALRAVGRERAARPEGVAGPEWVPGPAGRPGARSPGPGVLIPVGAEHVVLLALLRVGQDLVRLVDFLEPALGSLIAGIPVRVELARQSPIRLLDLHGRGRSRDAQGLVVVLVLHWPLSFFEGSPVRRSMAWSPPKPSKLGSRERLALVRRPNDTPYSIRGRAPSQCRSTGVSAGRPI